MSTSSHYLRFSVLAIALWSMTSEHVPAQASTEQSSKVTVDADGTVHVPAYAIPPSIYMSDEAKQAYVAAARNRPPPQAANSIAAAREATNRSLAPKLARAQAVYPVIVEQETMAGVRVTVVRPDQGIAKRNQYRVLISLHGGGFTVGSGPLQLIDSIPIAATAEIKVVSIDFRMAPEYKFPAASEDVAAVYRTLLKQYKPQNIGIYGNSTGGWLVAMSLAWFQKEKLPTPGAIGIFSAPDGISGGPRGDSRYVATPLAPSFAPPPPPIPDPPVPSPSPYFAGVDERDPLKAPIAYPEILSRFPPTLLITGTRDIVSSGVFQWQRQLVCEGLRRI